ncbi:hypothetical protein [Microbacterium sp. Leaf159]|uniref:hypothetical protein n=1 Tax=Microbacterium sp. Leaf159 TaxID=1736279 RepID=UPI0006FD9375|nr:hypothetical protein [Microbacterium sp. Leaf159]KQR38822.1 hypothetical protein ASF80_04935 [Microbacterium sp. Leaf159]
MTDEQQPDVRWAPMEPQPSNRGRIALIVGLIVAGLVIVGVLLFFLLPRGDSPAPGASETPSASASATPSATASPSAEPEPSMTPITTAPPVADPSVDAFRGQVQGWLNDALTGLDIVSDSTGQDAVSVVDTLIDDAQRLAETPPPSSIESEWRAALDVYAQTLVTLRTVVTDGGSTGSAIDDSRSAAGDLRAIVGL